MAEPGISGPIEPRTLGRVGWHELTSSDWEAGFAFYSAMFGWKKDQAFPMGAMGTYQTFSGADGAMIGGMMNRPPNAPTSYWTYYFNVGDIDAAAKRVKAGGGEILNGPMEVSDGSWIVECMDPQRARFALVGKRSPNPIGYFERVAPRDPSDPRGRRWSW